MTTVHASCVLIAKAGTPFDANPGDGVLILGQSGAGKSSAVLRLLAQGATLVADDRVELFVREEVLWARAPGTLAGLLEARGLGIVELPHAVEARVALAVRLGGEPPRYPEPQIYAPPRPLAVGNAPPLIRLSADDWALPEKIVLAAAAFANALFREKSKPS